MRIASALFAGPVYRCVVTLEIVRINDVMSILYQVTIALLALPELSLGPPSFGEITNEGREGRVRKVADGCNGEFNGNLAAIGTHCCYFDSLAEQ